MIEYNVWPVDEGGCGVRLDLENYVERQLPPCPGLGGWKFAPIGNFYWTNVKGPAAVELAAALLATPDGWEQDVCVVMDGGRLVSLTPAGNE